MSRPKSTTPREPDVRVEFLVTVEPTATDRTRYHAGSVWTMSAARARACVEAGEVKLLAPPARAITPPAAAFDADEE